MKKIDKKDWYHDHEALEGKKVKASLIFLSLKGKRWFDKNDECGGKMMGYICVL